MIGLGTVIDGSEETTLIVAPPAGAGCAKTTESVSGIVDPPTTDGIEVTIVKSVGLIVSSAAWGTSFTSAVITGWVTTSGFVVVIANVVEVAPEGITTADGTDAYELLEVKRTETPLAGAGVGIYTVPVAVFPP